MVGLTHESIDAARLLEQVQSPRAGGVVLFLGTVREFTHGKQTASLVYEAYHEMALERLGALEAEARERWGLVEVALVHRLGRLELGDIAVGVAVSAAHREGAFAAGRWLIDTIKESVPIWKQEHWADGTTEWQHPGGERAPQLADGGEGEL